MSETESSLASTPKKWLGRQPTRYRYIKNFIIPWSGSSDPGWITFGSGSAGWQEAQRVNELSFVDLVPGAVGLPNELATGSYSASDYFELGKPQCITGNPEDLWLGTLTSRSGSVHLHGVNLSAKGRSSLSESIETSVLCVSRLISPDLAARLRDLMSLPEGWDGEDSKPLRVDVLVEAVMLLRRLQEAHPRFVLPFIAPTFDGFVLLDWATAERTLELQVETSGWSIVGTLTPGNGEKEYFSASVAPDGAGVLGYYKWFCGEAAVWPTA